MSEQGAHGRAVNDGPGNESDVNFSNNGDATINGQIGLVHGDVYIGDFAAPSAERPRTVLVARASDDSRVNQAGRDQTVTGG